MKMKREEIKEIVEKNQRMKEFSEYPTEILKVMRVYINLKLTKPEYLDSGEKGYRFLRSCTDKDYNYIDYILSFKYEINVGETTYVETNEKIQRRTLCKKNCKMKMCINKSIYLLTEEIRKYNEQNLGKNLTPIEVIDYMLDRNVPQFNKIAEESLFEDVEIIDLMYCLIILENDFIIIDENEIDENGNMNISYLDVTKKKRNEDFINIMREYYANPSKTSSTSTININDKTAILKEKDNTLRKYKLAGYYKYLIEKEKIDIIKVLRTLLERNYQYRFINNRSNFFIYDEFKRLDRLPYSEKNKKQIAGILNYILNYRFKREIPYIPINIIIYSENKEGIKAVCEIISRIMWFFGYLSDNMKVYNVNMNNIILNKNDIKRIYYDSGNTKKEGFLILDEFEELIHMNIENRQMILNILADEIEKNNRNIVTVFYGDKPIIKEMIENNNRLSKDLMNVEIELDTLENDKIKELLIGKLEERIDVTKKVKEKIEKYIDEDYSQSETNDLEYVNNLYNQIILNMNDRFEIEERSSLKEKDIPEVYNTKNLESIMRELNKLIGLEDIKSQILDLVYLLKFNNIAKINMKDLNLHMVFKGNPGTGKTTVARLIKDIFYELGYIKKDKITEVVAKDLIAEYTGQTAGKTYKVVKSALGGILFIDEAYSIFSSTGGGTGTYGQECVATLLKMMEDYKDRFIIIFAGYEEEMEDFIDSNPGLASRIGYKIDFKDYDLEELTEIYLGILEENKMKIEDNALEKLKLIIAKSMKEKNFGNGRYMHNVFQKVLIEHAKNVEKKKIKSDIYIIKEEDIVEEKIIIKSKKEIGF